MGKKALEELVFHDDFMFAATIRHGSFTIIVNRGFIAFIKQTSGTLYKLHPLLVIQYKTQ